VDYLASVEIKSESVFHKSFLGQCCSYFMSVIFCADQKKSSSSRAYHLSSESTVFSSNGVPRVDLIGRHAFADAAFLYPVLVQKLTESFDISCFKRLFAFNPYRLDLVHLLCGVVFVGGHVLLLLDEHLARASLNACVEQHQPALKFGECFFCQDEISCRDIASRINFESLYPA